MLGAVIFDFDGVITDSEVIHLRCFNEVLAPHGIKITTKDYYKNYLGLNDRDLFTLLKDKGWLKIDSHRIDQLIEQKNECFEELTATDGSLIEGVLQFLKMLEQNAVTMAICSGALLSEIELILESAQIRSFFDVIVSAEQVKKGKPSPEGFLLTLKKLNDKSPNPISPGHCVVIEDSHWGLEAAAAAGMHTVAITNSYDADKLSQADKIVTHLNELSISDLQNLCADKLHVPNIQEDVTMNARQRWLETLLFDKPDRAPLMPGHARKSTLDRWHKEGLPENISDVIEHVYCQTGGSRPWPKTGLNFPVNERMIPQFEEKVIEKGPRTQIVQDWKGNICEISNEFTLEYLRDAIDFVTRRWIKCPVESPDDWEDMKRRYNPKDPVRLPKDPKAWGDKLAGRDWPIEIELPGPFWQLREWVGFENLCMMFHDNPTFVREMILFWDDYISRLLERIFQYFIPDSIYISEDMAYKGFSMVSPAMVREFLLPTWKHWGQIIRNAGVPIYAMDSDGFLGELIPIWIEAGINVCDPIEVAAGNDILEFRKRFGEKMAYRGGIDKRCIAQGGKAIEDEIKRIEPVIRDGGYIPGCDHGVPKDVSWPNFVYYVKLLAQSTEWL